MTAFKENASPDGRHCGACTACCTHLPIPAGLVGPGAKPAGIPCPHVGALGCRCYAQRPKVCGDFSCAWLHDPAWPAGWRPDRCGLMCLCETIDVGLRAAAVYEIFPQALERPETATILEHLQRTAAVIAVIDLRHQRRRLLGTWSAAPASQPLPAAPERKAA